MDVNRRVEEALLQTLVSGDGEVSSSPVFILGAPRTGSTVFYQAVCSRLGLAYIANLTNDFFADTPIMGLAIQKSVPVEVLFKSYYGKTEGAFQPSEGSAVMMRWFGGGHPSALVSARILNGAEPHFLRTLAAVETLFDAPLVIKNAWNSFRVPYLAQALRSARFIWMRRDVASAAKSDLAARYKTKGSASAWNSATPANVERLMRLPPPAQVVENQHEFNIAIGSGLRSYADGRWREIWYEDFREDPDAVLAEVGVFLGASHADDAPRVDIRPTSLWTLSAEDENSIDCYLVEHAARLLVDRYPAAR
jgi:hypothetical protein